MSIRSLCLAALLLSLSLPVSAQNPPAGTAAEPVATPAATPAVAAPTAGEQKKAATPFRLGYADLSKVAGESAMGKVAKTHFEAKADKLKSQIDTKQKLLEKQKAALQAKLPTYTPEQRSAKVKEFEKKVEELRKMLQKADREMRPLQEDLLKEVYGKIEKAAGEYGAANGFSLIMDKKDLLYIGKDVDVQDVTEALIKHLDGK